MRELLRIKKGGYYTVEATFIITICIVVLMAILYTGLYVHDRLVTESVLQRQTTRWIHQTEDEKWDDSTFKKKLKKELKKKLFLFSLNYVDIEDGLTKKTVKVGCDLPVSIGFLKRVWGGKSGMKEESVRVAEIWPAKWKWDADAVRGKTDKEKGSYG
ncbi:MAG: hypothetical protein VZQ83_03820 [Eubacterium sp.]|nr:hypothetical protein [Eubacterium sp.]